MEQNNSRKDELRWRFTAWLGTVMRNARKDYLEHESRYPMTISIDSLTEDRFAREDRYDLWERENDFDFAEKRISRELKSLSFERHRILKMLYIDELEPVEISRRLGCTIQHVYNLKSQTLSYLRKKLMEDAENEKHI